MTGHEEKPPRKPRSREVALAEPPAIATPPRPERQRVAKAMARAGLCSRRDAEAWVTAGRVAVNGEVLSSPARDVGPDDLVTVDGAPLPGAEKTRLFLFHKPRGLITSDHDPEGRDTVAAYLREHWPDGPRIVTIGRLDINTEGLLLLTNDGGLARVLELPDTGWLRRYRVRAKGETDQASLDALAAGITVDGVSYAGIEAKLDRIQGSNCWLTMGLREGKNREIKRVLEHLGLEVNRLIRLSFGPFQLLDLPEGAVEEVRTRVLRDQLGDGLAAAAGADFRERGAVPDEPVTVAPDRGRAKRTLGLRERSAAVPPDADAPRRERQPRAHDAPRRHVSALRPTEPDLRGPRVRVERTATKDRHDRTIAVERRAQVRPAPRPGGPKRASPSAEAKRVRVARSGHGAAEAGGQRARTFRDKRPEGGEGRRGSTPGGEGRAPRPFEGPRRERASPRDGAAGRGKPQGDAARGARHRDGEAKFGGRAAPRGATPDRPARDGGRGDRPVRASRDDRSPPTKRAPRAGHAGTNASAREAPGRGGPGRGRPGASVPGKGEVGRGRPDRGGSGRSDPGRSGPGKARPGKAGPGRGGADRGGRHKGGPDKVGPGKGRPSGRPPRGGPRGAPKR